MTLRPFAAAFTAVAFAAAGAAYAQAPAPAAAAPAAGAPAPAAAPRPPPPLPYGQAINLEQAKQVVAAAEAEATKRNLRATIAIVEPSGELVYFQKATDAPYQAYELAVKKARAAARLRRPTKFDQDRLAAGNQTLQFFEDVYPFGGGELIVSGGKIIGAIGETGGADVDVAKAGAAAIK